MYTKITSGLIIFMGVFTLTMRYGGALRFSGMLTRRRWYLVADVSEKSIVPIVICTAGKENYYWSSQTDESL